MKIIQVHCLLQYFFSREINFHFYQFLSNFFKYLSSNFLLSYSYNIFTIYFPSNSPLLKSFSSTISNFSCLLTSVLSLLLNSATAFFVFSKFSSFFYILFSAVNLFKYFTTPLIFLLFRISFISYSSNPSTSTSFTSFIFCSPTYFLYHTTQLIFTTR